MVQHEALVCASPKCLTQHHCGSWAGPPAHSCNLLAAAASLRDPAPMSSVQMLLS